MADSVKAVVLIDNYRWHDDPKDLGSPIHDAYKGDEISVSAEELKRGQGMEPAGLAKPGSAEAKAALDEDAESEPTITTPAGDVVEEYDKPKD